MDQLSKPVMIALAAVLSFACLWVVVLRPSAEEAGTPATAAPAPAAGAPDTAGPGSGPSATRDPVAARRAQRVLDALSAGKTVVLLFWNGRSADDRAVRRAVSGVDRKSGRVVVAVERLSRLSAYAPITNGVRVTQTPTVLIVGPNGQTQAIAGYTVPSELNQAVADARGRG